MFRAKTGHAQQEALMEKGQDYMARPEQITARMVPRYKVFIGRLQLIDQQRDVKRESREKCTNWGQDGKVCLTREKTRYICIYFTPPAHIL